MQRYNPKEIESKWQAYWDQHQTYRPDLNSDKPKYMAMSMFNYPSGAGIHIGHAMNYTISDVKARYKRQAGYESYHPIGWDAFGLPAENFAIKSGVSPQASMAKIIPSYHKQYKAMGWSNDWSREIATHEPTYYKWTQWIFAQMYKHGLAYQDARLQWWCEKDNTVVANEQLVDGKCWRHDGPEDPVLQQKEVKQWFFKITEYADELLDAIDNLDWTDTVKLAQKNWIGRSVGAEISFAVNADCTGRNYVFIHGFCGTNNSDFWPWLKTEIEKRGGTVYAPNLPNTRMPNTDEQAKYLLDSYEFTENTHIIAHSLGSAVALKLLPQLPTTIASVMLIAPCLDSVYRDKITRPDLDAASDWVFDFTAAKSKSSQCIVLEDENDHIIPEGKPLEYAHKLSANYHKVSTKKGHFNDSIEPAVLAAVIPSITVFTTRPDTIFGATFLVIAPENPLVEQLTSDGQKNAIETYIAEAKKRSEIERQAAKDKTGVFTGSYAVNPASGEQVPIWVADYVLYGYGTGAIMAVPAHDERDAAFATKFGLPQIPVLKGRDDTIKGGVYTEKEGVMINSGKYTNLLAQDAREQIVADLAEQGAAAEKVNYKMRDWSVSRQRYWGAPIPIIHCANCGPQLIADDQLPVVLPELEDFQPSGDGRSALARAEDWLNVNCPECNGPAQRETDTLDTYICSSWYMLRYLDPSNEQQIFDSALANKWMPVDFYNGGDHATAHLLYARFITRFFTKLGIVDNPEPFKQMLYNGKVKASDGSNFSKSKGNGIDPLEIIASGYGADALRTYLMFAAPLEFSSPWDPQGVPGTYRFLSRLWNLAQEYQDSTVAEVSEKAAADIRRTTHAMIKKVTLDLEENRYNTAISAAMTAVNELFKLKVDNLAQHNVWREAIEALVCCVAPFAPHMSEELWHQLGHDDSVHIDHWPVFNENYVKTDSITIVVQINGKFRAQIQIAADADNDAVINAAISNDKVAAQLADKEIKKTIVVPGKIINFVV